jgi:hypothetical protein
VEKSKKRLIILIFWFLILNIAFLSLYLIFYCKSFDFQTAIYIFLLTFFLLFFLFVSLKICFLEEQFFFQRKIAPDLIIFLTLFLSLFFIFFWFGFNFYSFLGFVLSLITLFEASRIIEKLMNRSLKFSFWQILSGTRMFFLSGFAILIAFVAFLSPKILGGKMFLPRSVYDFIFPKLEDKIASFYPGFSGEMSLNEFAFLMVVKNPPENFPINNVKNKVKSYNDLKNVLSEVEAKLGKEKMKEFLNSARVQLLRSFGFKDDEIKEIDGNQKVKEFFYVGVSKWLEKSSRAYKFLAGAIFGILIFFFFIVRFILLIISIVYLPLWVFLFEYLKKIGFFNIKVEKVDKEIITI